MNDYKKYLTRQLGLKEVTFQPFDKIDPFPGIDPAAQLVSPTAKRTPIIGVAIRGSVTGGLPSGADQTTPDLAPNKLGGYDRITPEDLNTTLVDKTPKNPEIKQETKPINQNPSTGQGVTHPHQIQVTAGEEPQQTTGASTDSDPTLKLKSGQPKGIEIDIPEEEPSQEETTMIPASSLSETFARHKKLALEAIKRRQDECGNCGCDDPNDMHGMAEAVPAPGQQDDLYAYHRAINSPEGRFEQEMAKQAQEPVVHALLKKMNGEKPKYIPPSGGAGLNETDDKEQWKKKNSDNWNEWERKNGKVKLINVKPCQTCGGSGSKDGKACPKCVDNPSSREPLKESYTPPFSRMRGLAGIGNVVLSSNGQWTDKTIKEHVPGKPFTTNWKMDKEKAGMVKVDEEKLKKVKAELERKSKRGTLSDKELQLSKRLNEVLKRRGMLKESSEPAKQHTWGKDGFCVYCHKVHRTDHNARSTCSDGFRCRKEEPSEAPKKQ